MIRERIAYMSTPINVFLYHITKKLYHQAKKLYIARGTAVLPRKAEFESCVYGSEVHGIKINQFHHKMPINTDFSASVLIMN